MYDRQKIRGKVLYVWISQKKENKVLKVRIMEVERARQDALAAEKKYIDLLKS